MMLLCRHASSAMRSFYDGDGNRAATAVVHRLLPRRPAARVTGLRGRSRLLHALLRALVGLRHVLPIDVTEALDHNRDFLRPGNLPGH